MGVKFIKNKIKISLTVVISAFLVFTIIVPLQSIAEFKQSVNNNSIVTITLTFDEERF